MNQSKKIYFTHLYWRVGRWASPLHTCCCRGIIWQRV